MTTTTLSQGATTARANAAVSVKQSAKPAASQTRLWGIILAVLSNSLFGVVYVYSHWLAPLTGTQVFLWRMVAMWGGLALLMALTHGFSRLRQLLASFTSLRQWALLLLPTPILASQFWLFMWAPVNGEAVNTAMGYFLFPLTMVIMGCLAFHERLSHWQWLAVGLAAAGVGMQIWQSGTLSWTTAWVCLSYPIYYGLRRWQGIPALLGLFIDLSVIAPVALAYILFKDHSLAMVASSGYMIAMLVGLGLISAVAMQSNLASSQLIPVNVFGMLSYIEPALMFILSVVMLHEVVNSQMLMSFGLIWAGILVMMIDAFLSCHPRQAYQNKSIASA